MCSVRFVPLGVEYLDGDEVISGILAQLGEHLPYKQRVIGSSPIGPIYDRQIS